MAPVGYTQNCLMPSTSNLHF